MSKENLVPTRRYSQRRIASTLGVSRNTVARIAKAAGQYPVPEAALRSMEEKDVHRLLFPEEALLSALYSWKKNALSVLQMSPIV